MTEDEQEALSHQHAGGFWCVPLASGAFAIFTHPNGRLVEIVSEGWTLGRMRAYASDLLKQRADRDEQQARADADAFASLDLSGIKL